MIKIETSLKDNILSIKNIEKDLFDKSDKAIQKVTAEISTHIKKRTLKGKDKKNISFKKYAKSTLKAKKEKGGRFFNGNVNLSDSGKMMSAMQPKRVSSSEGKVYFIRKEEALKASSHINGVGRLPKRDFFGINKKESNKFIKLYKDLVFK